MALSFASTLKNQISVDIEEKDLLDCFHDAQHELQCFVTTNTHVDKVYSQKGNSPMSRSKQDETSVAMGRSLVASE